MLCRLLVGATVALVGCGSSGSGGSVDAGPFTTSLRCPSPGSLPFVLDDQDWRFADNEQSSQSKTRIKHQPADILANPQVGIAYSDLAGDAELSTGALMARGVVARTEPDRGLYADVIPGELVSIWEYSEASGWQQLGSQITTTFADAAAGRYDIELDFGLPADQELAVRYAVLNAEQSCAAHYQFSLPTGRKVIVSDIDGTLTASDDELLTQLSNGSYDPLAKTSAGQLMQAWSAKGYQIIYMTARPHLLRSETRRWLDEHDYPAGAVLTPSDFVFDEAARTYKAAWTKRLVDDLQWDVVAVYGNAMSDIDAYEDAGISKEATFIIGENAGAKGTVAIENDDYTSHVQDYVMQQPDAN